MKLQDISHIEQTIQRAENIDCRSAIDIGEQLELRRERLAETAVSETPNEAFERVLGTNDLLPVSYFTEGLRAAKSVCRMVTTPTAVLICTVCSTLPAWEERRN